MLLDWQQQLNIVRDEFGKIESTRFVHTDDIFHKIFHWIKVIQRLHRIHKNCDALAAISSFCAADLHKYILSRCLTMLHQTHYTVLRLLFHIIALPTKEFQQQLMMFSNLYLIIHGCYICHEDNFSSRNLVITAMIWSVKSGPYNTFSLISFPWYTGLQSNT